MKDQDPRIVVKDPAVCDAGCTPVAQIFSFQLPGAPGGTFSGTLTFQNNSDVTWYNLVLTVKLTNGLTWQSISCGASSFFNFCQVVPEKKNPNVVEIEFLNLYGNGKGGITPGEIFSFGFSGQGGVNWPAGTVFEGHGYNGAPPSVPEPATMALLLTGAGAIVGRWKLGKKTKTLV